MTQVRGEADFVAFIPGQGVLCIEVKAHRRVCRDGNGVWTLGSDPPTTRSPFRQAEDNMYSLRALLRERAGAKADDLVVWFAVVFTHAPFNVPAVEWNEWEAIDWRALRRVPVSRLLTGVLSNARTRLPAKSGKQPPGSEECASLARALRPCFEMVKSPSARRDDARAEMLSLTEAQYAALDHMRPDLNPRVVFEGPAGTGKTLLAMEAVRRNQEAGRRTALLCFNNLLASWLRSEMPASVEVATLHALMLKVAGLTPPAGAASSYWEADLPAAAALALLEDNTPPRFDAIVIDEGQDLLRPGYLDFLDLLISGGLSAGEWIMFGDFERQAIYGAGFTLDALRARAQAPVFSLRDNCRNTPKIAQFASMLCGLNPGYSSILRGDEGPPPRTFYYEDAAEQKQIIEAILDGLYAEGFRGHDVLLLSAHKPGAAVMLTDEPWRNRIRPYVAGGRDGYIGTATIQAFKGLEAPAIILTDVDEVRGERAQALFYTGLTRATDRLFVVASTAVRADVIAIVQQGV